MKDYRQDLIVGTLKMIIGYTLTNRDVFTGEGVLGSNPHPPEAKKKKS